MSDLGLSSMDICRATDIAYRQLDYWATAGVITPTIADTDGKGTPRRWSHDDLTALQTIAQVAADLRHLGAQMPVELVARIWDLIKLDGAGTIATGTITIEVG